MIYSLFYEFCLLIIKILALFFPKIQEFLNSRNRISNDIIRHRAAGTVACTMSTQGPVSSPPVFQSSRLPDPVPVGVGVWSRSLETHTGASNLKNPILGGTVVAGEKHFSVPQIGFGRGETENDYIFLT